MNASTLNEVFNPATRKAQAAAKSSTETKIAVMVVQVIRRHPKETRR